MRCLFGHSPDFTHAHGTRTPTADVTIHDGESQPGGITTVVLWTEH